MKDSDSFFIILTKIGIPDNPVKPTPHPKDYKPNSKTSVPIGYQVKGYVFSEPTVGKTLCVFKNEDSKTSLKTLTTSTITKITSEGFYTLNSIYKLQKYGNV